LGNIDAPFFSAPQKQKREKRRKGTPFFAVPDAGLGAYVEFINRPIHLTASASPGPAPSGGGRIPPLRRYVSAPGAAYDLHAPISASLRRVRSSVRRKRPTSYACTTVRLPPPPACPWGVPACGGLCGGWCRFISLEM